MHARVSRSASPCLPRRHALACPRSSAPPCWHSPNLLRGRRSRGRCLTCAWCQPRAAPSSVGRGPAPPGTPPAQKQPAQHQSPRGTSWGPRLLLPADSVAHPLLLLLLLLQCCCCSLLTCTAIEALAALDDDAMLARQGSAVHRVAADSGEKGTQNEASHVQQVMQHLPCFRQSGHSLIIRPHARHRTALRPERKRIGPLQTHTLR
jgi:hypothetical protein